MENRFGVKDFILFLALAVLIGIVVLAMFQYDRQWADIRSIRERLDEQGRDLRDLQRSIERGVAVVGTPGNNATPRVASTNPADYPKDDPFARLRAARAHPDFAEGDWMVESFPGTVAKLTPLISHDLYSREVHYLVLETLVSLDPDTLEYAPLLAKSWTMDDKVDAYNAWAAEQRAKGVKDEDLVKDPAAPVPLTVTFTLRDGIRFSDGTPIRPEDFVFAFKFTMDKRIAAPQYQAYLEKIRSVEKAGDNRLVVKFREPYYDSLGLFSMLYALPEHFYSKYSPEQFNESTGLLLGSGPYRLESPTGWTPGGGQITVVRNERYWGVPGSFDRFVFKEFTLDQARQTAFRNGEVDIMETRPEQYQAMIGEEALVRRSHHFDWLSLNGGYRYVAWQQMKNGKPTHFADKRVRQAMALLVDRQRLVQEVMLGYAELATGPFSPASIQIDKSIKPVPYNVAQGRKLLADVGFTDKDGDGVLEGPDGRPFRFKLTYPSGSANYEKMVLAFKDAYARAGIVLDPDPVEWGAFSQKLRSKDFEAVTLGWGGGNPEADVYQMFHSKWTGPNGDNFMCYINPELDKILEQARTTVNKEKRIPLWHKAHRIFAEDQPYMFLWFTKEMFWVDGRIKNVRPTPLGMPSSLHTEWYVPRDKRKWAK